MNLCGRFITGVKQGEGIGVGISRIGDRHLLMLLGISNKMLGGLR